jgi:hypothetical protein
MNNKIIAGIDPGKKGAVAVIGKDHSIIVKSLTWTGRDIELDPLADILSGVDLVALEDVDCGAVLSRKSAMTFGDGFGSLRTLLRAWHIPFILVKPNIWKRTVLIGLRKGKDASVLYCQRKYPQLNLKKTDDGLADAICIAEYAAKQENGK